MSFETIKSSIDEYIFADWDKLISDINKYEYAIIYKLDGVEILRGGYIAAIDKDKFLEVRAFNEIEELHVVQVDGGYIGRTRADTEGEQSLEVEVVDESHLLWGKPQPDDNTGEYTFLSEDRGTQFNLPLKVNENQRAFVMVRNYLNPCKDVFEFNDYRMVKFFAEEVTEYGNK